MSLSADRKHVDQPAANNCSGLVPSPGFPGSVNLTSRRPSSVRELPPSRPPVVWALAVYSTLSRWSVFGCFSEAVLVANCSMIIFLRFLTKRSLITQLRQLFAQVHFPLSRLKSAL